MTSSAPFERYARRTAIVVRPDEVAAAFMQLGREVRELLRAESGAGPVPRELSRAPVAAADPDPSTLIRKEMNRG